jgi:hypothetical protein
MLDDLVLAPPTDVFTPRELARLAIYRAAVHAGFYNEEVSKLPRRNRVAANQEHSNGLGTDLPSPQN